jgi:hypothetical protein
VVQVLPAQCTPDAPLSQVVHNNPIQVALAQSELEVHASPSQNVPNEDEQVRHVPYTQVAETQLASAVQVTPSQNPFPFPQVMHTPLKQVFEAQSISAVQAAPLQIR